MFSKVEVGRLNRAEVLVTSSGTLDKAQIGAVVQSLGKEPFQQAHPSSTHSSKVRELKSQTTRPLTTRNSPRSSTVKGKKELARSRARQGLCFSAGEGRKSDLGSSSQHREGIFVGLSDGSSCNPKARPRAPELVQAAVTMVPEMGSNGGECFSGDFGLDRGDNSLEVRPSDGEQAHHNFVSSLPSNSGVQPAASRTGIGFGDSTTHGSIVQRRGSDEAGPGADRIELEEGGGAEASL